MWEFLAGAALQTAEGPPLSSADRDEIAASCSGGGECSASVATVSLSDDSPTVCVSIACNIGAWARSGVFSRIEDLSAAAHYGAGRCSMTKSRAAERVRPFVIERFNSAGIPLSHVDASEDLLVVQARAPLPPGAARAVYEVTVDFSTLPSTGQSRSPCSIRAEAWVAAKYPPSQWRQSADDFASGLTSGIFTLFYGGGTGR
jgi:hypothetical protein